MTTQTPTQPDTSRGRRGNALVVAFLAAGVLLCLMLTPVSLAASLAVGVVTVGAGCYILGAREVPGRARR